MSGKMLLKQRRGGWKLQSEMEEPGLVFIDIEILKTHKIWHILLGVELPRCRCAEPGSP